MRPHFPIAVVMALVAIAALNFWVFRVCYYELHTNDAATANKIDVLYIGSIPMANILAIGLLIGYRSRGRHRVLWGFEAFGAVALVLYIALTSLYCHELVRPYLFLLLNPVFDAIGRSQAHIPIFRFTSILILGWPQLAFALFGGFLAWMFRPQPPRLSPPTQ